MVSGVSGINLQHNPYGSIRRSGKMQNGRLVYDVIDSDGKSAGKLSVPENQSKIFEIAYNDIITSAAKIQKYVAENSSENDLKRRRAKSQAIVTIGGVSGAAAGVLCSWNKSVLKKILITGCGIVAGLAGGFIGAFVSSLPPGTGKFERATKTLSKLDIQNISEE